MMNFHRARVNVWFKRIVSVTEVWECVCHKN
jgi:hypothetical protein